jgi:hypothetical protein
MTDANIPDPWAEETNTDDPWATPEDVKSSGAFEPTPFLDSLAGRTVGMFPRKFEKEAPKRADRIEPGGATTEERYTVDMVVLDGGELRYWYTDKKANDGAGELVEHVIPADEIPKLYTNVWRTEGNVIGALRKIDGKARGALLGVVRRGPQAADKKKGVTADQIEAAYAAWEARGKQGPKPKFSWIVDVEATTPEAKATASAWLRKAMAEGFSL